jgi:hypothetical protein
LITSAPEIAQHLAAERPGDQRAHFDDPQALQRRVGHAVSLPSDHGTDHGRVKFLSHVGASAAPRTINVLEKRAGKESHDP